MEYVHLQTQQVNVVSMNKSDWDSINAIVCDQFSSGLGWTCFDSSTEHTITMYDSIKLM